MSTFALIHGAGDVGWSWHLTQSVLRDLGHDSVAPDLPCEDDSAGLNEYADVVVQAIGDREDIVVVGHSFGGFVAPLVAARVDARLVVYLAGMVPAPGESPNQWWKASGYPGHVGEFDMRQTFLHDVAPELAEEAMKRSRDQSEARMDEPWPLAALPDIPAKFILGTQDRFFPAPFFRELVPNRLGIVPDEIDAGHCAPLSRPVELAGMLHEYVSGSPD
jgi:pimeloyl-ACP methyl ester carboxylesterase